MVHSRQSSISVFSVSDVRSVWHGCARDWSARARQVKIMLNDTSLIFIPFDANEEQERGKRDGAQNTNNNIAEYFASLWRQVGRTVRIPYCSLLLNYFFGVHFLPSARSSGL